MEVVVDYGADLDLGVANGVAGRGVGSGVHGFVDSGVQSDGFVFEVGKAAEYDFGVGSGIVGVCVFSAQGLDHSGDIEFGDGGRVVGLLLGGDEGVYCGGLEAVCSH